MVVSISILYFTKPLISLYFSKDKKEIISEEERIVLTLKKDLLFEELGTLLIKKELINNSKAILLAGGLSLQTNMYPEIYKLSKNINEIKVPIITLGIGSKNHNYLQ